MTVLFWSCWIRKWIENNWGEEKFLCFFFYVHFFFLLSLFDFVDILPHIVAFMLSLWVDYKFLRPVKRLFNLQETASQLYTEWNMLNKILWNK